MKRTFLLIVLVLSSILVFGGGATEGTAGSEKIAVNPPGVLPVVNETVTITGFIPSIGFIDDIKTNASVVALEKKTNVHVEWIESSKVDARNKLSILLAGGDYPGFLMGAVRTAISNQEIFKYGQQGVFLPLDDAIARLGYHTKELFEAQPFAREAITSPDGNSYSLPFVRTDDYHMTMGYKLFINTTWLDNLGLSMPETLDEFYDMLVAFKRQDANGNGDPNDEIPLTGSKRAVEDTAMWIMNAFVIAGGGDQSGDALLNQYEYIVDGKVFFNANKPEFREGLRFIRKIYQEGLFDVAALTQDRDQIKPLVDGGTATRVGGAASHHPGNFANLGEGEEARFRQYKALPPIEGPQGNRTTSWSIDNVIVPGMFVITDKIEHFDAAFRWADHQFSLDFGMQDRGIEGVHWRKVEPDEGKIGLNGEPAKWEYLKVLTPEDNAQINLGPGWTRNIKNEFAKSEGFSYEEFLYNQTLLYEPYKVTRYPWATVPIAAEDTDEFTDLRRTIHTFIGESIDRFIIGDLDIESDWDSYVEQLNQIGLRRFLEILEKSIKSS